MILGNESLKSLFPSFEEDVKENGIDLRIGKVEHTTNRNNKLIGCIDGEKHLPVTYEVAPSDGVYKFYPHNYYTIVIDRPIHIPDGYCQFYFIRSTKSLIIIKFHYYFLYYFIFILFKICS